MTSYLSTLTSKLQNTSLSTGSISTSSLSSTLTTRFQTVRQALTAGGERDDETDENLSHVSNVLRAYYTEKGKSFPQWLPPDPRAPPPPVVQPAIQYGGSYGGMNNPYGQQQGPGQNQRMPGGNRTGGGLSDLFGDSGNNSPAPQQPAASQSLRARVTGGPKPSHISQSSISSVESAPGAMTGGPRPLPSQRVGSYQTAGGASAFTRGGSTGSTGSGTAQDRLRARFQGGGGKESPPPSSGSGGSGYGNSAYGGSSGSGGGQPVMSASRPWDSGGSAQGFDGGYGGGGYGGGSSGAGGSSSYGTSGAGSAAPPQRRGPPMGGGLPGGPRSGLPGSNPRAGGPRPQRMI